MNLMTWTRRGLLASAAAAALALGALPSPIHAQTPPDVLIVGQVAEPKSLDPAAVTAVNDFRILVNVYEGLTRYKSGTLEVEPRWPPDGRSARTAPNTRSPCAKASPSTMARRSMPRR